VNLPLDFFENGRFYRDSISAHAMLVDWKYSASEKQLSTGFAQLNSIETVLYAYRQFASRACRPILVTPGLKSGNVILALIRSF
jgi:hypothetical protein